MSVESGVVFCLCCIPISSAMAAYYLDLNFL